MDGIVIANSHARAYADKVAAWPKSSGQIGAQYRYWEIQNGNHVDSFKLFFPQFQRNLPHVQNAFDLMVKNVETGAALPPSQYVPLGGAISANPVQRGLCPQLLAPLRAAEPGARAPDSPASSQLYLWCVTPSGPNS
jgi:3HB-oligomer hydrolase (3HBOH)